MLTEEQRRRHRAEKSAMRNEAMSRREVKRRAAHARSLDRAGALHALKLEELAHAPLRPLVEPGLWTRPSGSACAAGRLASACWRPELKTQRAHSAASLCAAMAPPARTTPRQDCETTPGAALPPAFSEIEPSATSNEVFFQGERNGRSEQS